MFYKKGLIDNIALSHSLNTCKGVYFLCGKLCKQMWTCFFNMYMMLTWFFSENLIFVDKTFIHSPIKLVFTEVVLIANHNLFTSLKMVTWVAEAK